MVSLKVTESYQHLGLGLLSDQFFNSINHVINYFNHVLIAVLTHIFFVLYYRCGGPGGNGWPEIYGCGHGRHVRKLFTDATLCVAADTDGRTLTSPKVNSAGW